MKILHTADWHLGHRLHEQSQIEEQILFLGWIENYIVTEKIDVLLISGDVFDSGSPSNQSKKIYYDFLVKLLNTNCKNIIITGGNHDSPDMINAPKEILNALNIKVIGKATENIVDEVFEINVNDEKIIIGAVPYLRDQDIRRAVAGESFDELVDKYKQALTNHYFEVANYCQSINKNKVPIIAMGHLFATGGSVSDSEQNIYVGTLGHIGADDFPTIFDYIALGHLHRPQIIGNNDKIRYSGSPYILSFSEINYDKKVIVIETKHQSITKINEAKIPRFREIYRLKGTVNECLNQYDSVISNSYELTPWVEIVLDEKESLNTDELKQKAELHQFEILKITLNNDKRKRLGIEELLKNTKSIKELQPDEVFKLKCKEQHINLDENPQLWDAFNEILQTVKKQ
jgi:exonuclease SbcD